MKIFQRCAAILFCMLSATAFGASQVYTPGSIPQSSTLMGGNGTTANMAVPVAQVYPVTLYGAKGDGTTDNTTAIQTAINVATFLGGGEVFFPPGFFCTFTGVTVSSGTVQLVGAGQNVSNIGSCGRDVTVVTINYQLSHIENIDVIGKGSNNDTGTFGANNPVIVMGPSCIECLIIDVSAFGGSSTLVWQSGEAYVYRFKAADHYGNALVYVTGGGWPNRMKLDQPYPGQEPCTNTTVNAWVAATSYSANQCATVAGYIIQAMTTGTSGSVAPTLKNFGINFSDGSITWQLAAWGSGYAFQMDTGASEIYATQMDLTGAEYAGFAMTNTLSGTQPQSFKCSQCLASQAYSDGFLFTSGTLVYLTDATAGCFGAGCSAVNFLPSFSGNANVEGGNAKGMPYGLTFGSGGRLSVHGFDTSGATIAGMVANGSVTDFTWIGNISAGSAVGYQTGGTADYYSIIGNICGPTTTTCVSDGASGTHKTLSGNN